MFAFFVSIQLKRIFTYLFKFLQLYGIFKKNIVFSEINYHNFFYLHLTIEDYFLCISLCELVLANDNTLSNKKAVYFSLGLVYTKLSYWNIAEYYYLQLLNMNPDDTQTKIILSRLYSSLGHKVNELIV